MILNKQQIQEKLINVNTKIIRIYNEPFDQHAIWFLTKDNEIILAGHSVSGNVFTFEGYVGEKYTEKGEYIERR